MASTLLLTAHLLTVVWILAIVLGVEFSPDKQLIYLQISFIILTLIFTSSEWV